MLGWEISVFNSKEDKTPDKVMDLEPFYDQYLIASWSVGMGGLDWIDDLCKNGMAEDLGGNGYPKRYRVAAKYVLAAMSSEDKSGKNPLVIGEDYIMPINWSSGVKVNVANLAPVEPEHLLLIEAWDQS